MSSVPLPWCTSKSMIATRLQVVPLQRVFGGNGHVIEKAKSARLSRGTRGARVGAPSKRHFPSHRPSLHRWHQSPRPQRALSAAVQVWMLTLKCRGRSDQVGWAPSINLLFQAIGIQAANGRYIHAPMRQFDIRGQRQPWALTAIQRHIQAPKSTRRSSMASSRSGHSGWPATHFMFPAARGG
jgi:hypothetical protein